MEIISIYLGKPHMPCKEIENNASGYPTTLNTYTSSSVPSLLHKRHLLVTLAFRVKEFSGSPGSSNSTGATAKNQKSKVLGHSRGHVDNDVALVRYRLLLFDDGCNCRSCSDSDGSERSTANLAWVEAWKENINSTIKT